MNGQTFANVGIAVPSDRAGEFDTLCPRCSATRKKRNVKCLSVNTVDGTWFCHHCGWSGGLNGKRDGYGARLQRRPAPSASPKVYTIPKPPRSAPMPPQVVEWFAGRGIPESVLIAAGISAGQEFCPQLGRFVLAIRFPCLRDGALVNVKYRALLEKCFWMVRGAQRILYGLDDIAGAETACVVEGEIDALSIRTAGGPSTVSVPDGAPPADATHFASKFVFLDETAMARLRAARTVLIGTDMDAPGERLAEELARRIDSSRCRRVSWAPHKDANDMLIAQGPQAVRDGLASAQPFTGILGGEIPDGARAVRLLPSMRVRRAHLRMREVAHA